MRNILSIFVAVLLLVSVAYAAVTPLSSCADLAMLQSNPSGNFALTTNILIDCAFTTATAEFTGSLSGAGFAISGLTAPLFTDISGQISDLSLVGSAIMTDQETGILAARLIGATARVDDVVVVGGIIEATSTNDLGGLLFVISSGAEVNRVFVGELTVNSQMERNGAYGVVVFSTASTIRDTCVVNVMLNGGDAATGFAATAQAGGVSLFENCFVNGGTTASCGVNPGFSNDASGFILDISNTAFASTFRRCYTTATVSAVGPTTQIGRFIARAAATSALITENCFFQFDSVLLDDGVLQPADPVGEFRPGLDAIDFAGGAPTVTTLTAAGFISANRWSTADGVVPPVLEQSKGFVVQDPHFFPLWKSNPKHFRYSPKSGIRGAVYNIITHPLVQWNAMFDTYKNVPENWEDPEFIVEAAFTIRHPLSNKNFSDARILIKPQTYSQNRYYSGYMTVELNGQVVSSSKPILLFGEQFPSYFLTRVTNHHVFLSTPFFSCKYHLDFVSNNFLSNVKTLVRVLNGRPKARWPFLNAETNVGEPLEDAHGLLGQTMKPTSPLKPPTKDCFSCFVEGKMSDYRLEGDDLFGNQFKFNQF